MNKAKPTSAAKKAAARQKKTDGYADDEEAKVFMEKQVLAGNDHKINVLESQVSAIKSISLGLSNQLETDEKVIGQLGSSFDRTKELVGKTLGKLDELVTRGSNSLWTYVLIFFLIFVGLLYKLS